MEKDAQMPHYRDPLMEKTSELKAAGFDTEFQIVESGLKSLKSEKIYQSNEIQILEVFRFEGITNPDDMAVIYAIETNVGEKGAIVDAYGLYSDDDLGAFLKNVEQKTVGQAGM